MLALASLLLTAGATLTPSVGRVILISVDGLRADALEKLGSKGAPTFARLMREGASTLNGRSDRTWTYTMPNHVCMVTGRPAAGPEGHGYLENSFDGASIHLIKRAYVASVFDVVHDHGFRAAMVASKPKFALFGASYVDQGESDLIAPDDGKKKIDQVTITFFDDRQSIDAALDLLRITVPPRFLFLHLAGTDITGHTYGFDITDGSKYLDEVQRQDRGLAKILFAIDARGSLRKSTAIILTSDHGGDGRSHGDADHLENFRVPFIVWGANVAGGKDLYQLNRTNRSDPGKTKEGERPPIRNCEAGNLALSLLKLPPIPKSVIGFKQDLAVH